MKAFGNIIDAFKILHVGCRVFNCIGVVKLLAFTAVMETVKQAADEVLGHDLEDIDYFELMITDEDAIQKVFAPLILASEAYRGRFITRSRILCNGKVKEWITTIYKIDVLNFLLHRKYEDPDVFYIYAKCIQITSYDMLISRPNLAAYRKRYKK